MQTNVSSTWDRAQSFFLIRLLPLTLQLRGPHTPWRDASCLKRGPQLGPQDEIPVEMLVCSQFIKGLVWVFCGGFLYLPPLLLLLAPSFKPLLESLLGPGQSFEFRLWGQVISEAGSGPISHSSAGLGLSPTQIPFAFCHRYFFLYNAIL